MVYIRACVVYEYKYSRVVESMTDFDEFVG